VGQKSRENLVWATGIAVLCLILATLALELWNADLTLPLDDRRNDVTANLMVAKSAIHDGWFLVNDQLGAPFHQDLRDYPSWTVWDLHFGAIKALGLVDSNPVTALNLYFLITFPLAGIAAFLVLRRLEVSPPSAAACAVLFAFLPDHFTHGEAHIGVAAYFVVPAGAYLALAILSGWTLFARRANGTGPLRWASKVTLSTVALCLMIALADEYYTAFTIVLVAVFGVVRSIGQGRWRPLATAGLVVLILGATFAAHLTPTIIYRAENGANPVGAGVRPPFESEIHSTNLARLVLPVSEHRVEPLAEITRRYDEHSPIGGEGTTYHLGLIASLGFLLLLLLPVAAIAGRLRGTLADTRMRQASGAAVTLFLLGTTGGFSALIANLLTGQLRSWGRVSVFIGFFALIAVAVLLDRLRDRLAPVRRGRELFLVVLVAVVTIGFLDQTTPGFVPDYEAQRAQRESRAALVDEIEARIPQGQVLELPARPFPEYFDPTNSAQIDYDPALPYLDSETLAWSYGAMRGRPEDWLGSLEGLSTDYVLTAAATAGFDGVWVDHLADARSVGEIDAAIARLTSTAPLESADGRYSFSELSGLAGRIRALIPPSSWAEIHQAALQPPVPTWDGGFYDQQLSDGTPYRWVGSEATLELENQLETTRSVVLRARAESPVRPSMLVVTLPDGEERTFGITPAGTGIDLEFELPPGTSEVRFSTDAPEALSASPLGRPGQPSSLRFRLIAPTIAQPALLGLVRSLVQERVEGLNRSGSARASTGPAARPGA
jgi:phosphoglycerol transferase